jgi:ketopantoate hydroxymethyltransferase
VGLINLIKTIALFRNASKIKKSIKEADMGKVKSGLKTTEFYLALLGAAIPVVNTHLGLNLPSGAVLGIAGIIVSYILGRSIVKK